MTFDPADRAALKSLLLKQFTSSFDYLTIHDGPSKTHYCGGDTLPTFHVSSSNLKITFKTARDPSKSLIGFKIGYELYGKLYLLQAKKANNLIL